MRKLLFVLLICLIVVMPATAQDNLTELTVFMPFIPNIQFAPVYVAIEKGYFEDAGFNVTLEYGNEPDGVELIASGEMDYGFISGEQVILARANERPVVYVYEWYQRNPIAIVVPQVEGGAVVSAPGDLAGLSVGVPGRFGATYSSLTALLASAELTESDIKLEEIGFNAPEVVCVGGVEAATVYINNEPLQIRSRAEAGDCGDVTGVEVIAVADYADLVSNGIVTSEAKINDNPSQVDAFVEAFDKALQDTIANPLEAYLLSEAHIEGLPLENPGVIQNASYAIYNDATTRDDEIEAILPALSDEERTQVQVLLETVKLWEADMLGITESTSWELTQVVLVDMGFIEEDIVLDDAYTNIFVPAGDE